MDNKQGNRSCFSKIGKYQIGCFVCSIFTLILIGYLTYIYSRPLWYQFEEEKCYINDIKYPTINNSDSELWQSCSCGNDCKSISPCIKMYVNVTDSDKMFIYETNDQKKNRCAFNYGKCKPVTQKNMMYYLKLANKTYHNYNNKTITCHIDYENNLAYMKISLSNSITIVTILVIIAAITILICICQCFM